MGLLVFILGSRPDYMNTLTLLLNYDDRFKNMLDRILLDACNAPGKANGDNNTSKGFLQTLDFVKRVTNDNQLTTTRQIVEKIAGHHNPGILFLNLQQFLRILTPAQQTEVISKLITLSSKLPSNILPSHVTHTITWVKNVGVKINPVYIAVGILALETVKCIHDWWIGNITGVRCAKMFVESSAAIAGGCLGAGIGISVGTAVMPIVGSLVGAVAGGFLGATLLQEIAKRLTDYFFNLPKDIAVENAYAFLQIEHTCTNLELREAYKKLLLVYHPDKGGSKEKFCKLQISVAIISQARGQDLSVVCTQQLY